MNKDVNALCAVGGVMICAGFFSYIWISYVLSYLLFIFGAILFIAGLMTLDKK